MSIVPLTVIVGLCLVFTFVVFFLREQGRGHLSSPERDSLLPLADETPRLARGPSRSAPASPGCGCAAGHREPCAGCLRR